MDIDRFKPVFRLAALGLLAACLALPWSPALALEDKCPAISTTGGAGFTQVHAAPSYDPKLGSTIMTWYYPDNATAKNAPKGQNCTTVIDGKDGYKTFYLKTGTPIQMTLESSQYHQKVLCSISASDTAWNFANNCTRQNAKHLPGCNGCQYLNDEGKSLDINPGQVPKQFVPVPVNKVKGTKRVSIKNNCGGDAWVVLTPASGDDDLKRYNTQLWKRAANESGMALMYANPTDLKSTALYRSKVAPGSSLKVWVPNGGIASGNFGVLLGCTGEPSGYGWPSDCIIGGLPGLKTSGVGTVFEYTAGCKADANCSMNPSDGSALGGADYLDLSMVSGYNIPMSMEVANNAGFNCSFTKMTGKADLYDCPKENLATIAANSTLYMNNQYAAGVDPAVSNNNIGRAGCMSPEQWMGDGPDNTMPRHVSNASITVPTIADFYACNVMPSPGADADPDNCKTPGCGGPQCSVGPLGTRGDYTPANVAKSRGKPYTNYVKYLKAVGSQAYAWQFNDDASTMVCSKAGAEIAVTLCPGEAGQKPYAKQKWGFKDGDCGVAKEGKYDTLLACMKDNFDYTCQSEIVAKKRKDTSAVTATLNYCKPVKKGTAGAVSYDTCMADNAQVCQSTGKTPAKK